MGNEEAEIVNSTVKLTCGESLLLKLGGTYVLVTAAPPAPAEPAEATEDQGQDPLLVDLEDWLNKPPVSGPGTEPSSMPMIAAVTAGTLKLDLDPLVGTLEGQPLKDATSLRSLRVGNRMQLIVPGDQLSLEDLADTVHVSEHGTAGTDVRWGGTRDG
jgi:hypothetical protein